MNAEHQSADFRWNHMPLDIPGPDGTSWCLELPSEYFASAAITVLLTIEQPRLIESPSWSTLLELHLRESADDLAALRMLGRILRRARRRDVSIELRRRLERHLPDELLGELDVERLGNRHKQAVLDDFDRVERLRAMDEMLDAGFDIIANGKPRGRAPNDVVRYVEVAEAEADAIGDRARRGTGKSGYSEGGGEYKLVKNRTERVDQVCEVLTYLVVQCDSHDRLTLITPQPRLHATLQFARASAIEQAGTIETRYRACLRTKSATPPLSAPPHSWLSEVPSPLGSKA